MLQGSSAQERVACERTENENQFEDKKRSSEDINEEKITRWVNGKGQKNR